jgi:pimeloyl-ACP methyl ester carboxylesterase
MQNTPPSAAAHAESSTPKGLPVDRPVDLPTGLTEGRSEGPVEGSTSGQGIELRGVPVHVHTGGRRIDTNRPVVMLIHGAGNDGSVWRFQARALGRAGYCVLAPDLPGHGRSGGPALGSTLEMAVWVVELLGQLGVQRLALGGHSMGSLVALHAAALLGDRVSALILVGTAAPMKVAPALLEMALSDPAATMQQITQFSVAQPKPAPDQAQPDPAAIARAEQIRLALGQLMARNQAGYAATGNLLHTDLNACDSDTSALTDAAQLRCAVHLISGSKDKMTPPKAALGLQAALGEALQGAHTLECGHTLMAEQNRGVLHAMQAALTGQKR